MRKFLIAGVLFLTTAACAAQTPEEMLMWLNNNVNHIDAELSRTYNQSSLKKISFTPRSSVAKGTDENYIDWITLKSVTREGNIVVLRSRRANNFLELRIGDAEIAKKYVDYIHKYAYSKLNVADSDKPVYEASQVDEEAVFSKEPNAWKSYLTKRLIFDPAYKHKVPYGTYVTEIKFVVTKDGTLKGFKRVTNNPKGIEEILLLLLYRSPAWVPALKNGKPVSSVASVKLTLEVKAPSSYMEEFYYDKYKDLDLNLVGY